jgi:ketol-acid reductoisomerase
VSGWLIDATSSSALTLASQLAGTSGGHRMALVDTNYHAEAEIAAYQTGAFYACGDLVPEWVEGFLGFESQACSAKTLISN